MEATPPARTGIAPGGVVGETFSIYRDNALPLLGASAVVFVVVGLVSGLLRDEGVLGALLATVVSLVGYALFTGFVVRLVQDVRDGRRDQTIGDLFSSATPAIGPLIGFGILFGIAVGIGFVLLIVPGLFLLTIWCLGAPSIVAERRGVLEAFGRSRELVRGEGWSVFGALVLVLLIVIGIGIVLGILATPIGDGETSTVIASIISNIITAPIFAIAVSAMFFDLGGGAVPAPGASPDPSPPPPAAPGAP